MCLNKCYVFVVFFAIFLNCHALNCRSDGGPKEEELKTIYLNCLKRQDSRNSTKRGYFTDDDWRDSKGHTQRSQDKGSRDDRMGGRDDRMSSRDDRMSGRDDRMGNGDDRMGNRNDRMGNRDDRMGNRDDRMGNRDDRMPGRDTMGRNDDRFGRTEISGRDDFPQSDEFKSEMPQYNTYRSSTQSSRRYKREKRIGMNSGQRSQYNPNSTQRPGYDDSYRNDERNSSENSSKKDMDKKACALHCFLENLEMTVDNGMPDRYLVTHAITKNVKNEDLKDFLQESIEECFQILDNENTEDKCEFSKNLLLCLSEKGRANCDDWKEDGIQF